jgi:hypothetical protein
MNQNNSAHRHVIDFDRTSERDGFIAAPGIDTDQLAFSEAWQFPVCPESRHEPECFWRVHGFIVDDVFFVVWLDPDHKLYPISSRV